MSKKKKQTAKSSSKKKGARKSSASISPELQRAAEGRTAEAATVAWMLSLMATILAEVVGMLCRWFTVLVEANERLQLLSVVMLFVALLAGIITLVMTPVVLRLSKVRPPSAIIQLAVVAGVLPLVAVVLRSLQG